MSLSHVASSIPSSPTLTLNEEARILREKGEPVIHLGIGEPKQDSHHGHSELGSKIKQWGC